MGSLSESTFKWKIRSRTFAFLTRVFQNALDWRRIKIPAREAASSTRPRFKSILRIRVRVDVDFRVTQTSATRLRFHVRINRYFRLKIENEKAKLPLIAD